MLYSQVCPEFHPGRSPSSLFQYSSQEALTLVPKLTIFFFKHLPPLAARLRVSPEQAAANCRPVPGPGKCRRRLGILV